MIEAELERLAPMPELERTAAAPAAGMPRAVLLDLDGTLIYSVRDTFA